MADPRDAAAPSTHPALDHAAHDLLLVAEAADRDGRLPASLAACAECQALHTDLVALAAAVPTAALPARPRDYALTEADAARLRPAGWRRWLAAIGTSRDAVTRPLAVGLTTIGLAGLLVATVPGALSSGASTAGAAPSALQDEVVTMQGAAPYASAAAAPAASAAPAEGTTRAVGGGATNALNPAAPQRDLAVTDAGASPLALVSGVLVVVGAGLLLGRRLAVRAHGGR